MQKSGEAITPEEARWLAGLNRRAAEFVAAVKERWPGAELVAVRRPVDAVDDEAVQ